MWHLDQISVGTKYDKFEKLTQLIVGEYKTYFESNILIQGVPKKNAS